jgi:hypothetical protein
LVSELDSGANVLIGQLLPFLVVTLAWADPPAPPESAGAAPSDVRALLDAAAADLLAGHAESTLQSLQAVERAEPDNPWLWLYRGMAHRQLHQPYQALESLDRARQILLDLGESDIELSETVRRLRRDVRREVFGFSLQTGLAYDTNVSYLAGGAAQRGLIAGDDDGLFSSQFRLDFAPIADRRHKLTTGVRLGYSWHFAIEQFDYQNYGAYLRYAHRLTDRWELSLQYDYDVSLLANDRFLSNHALTAAAAHRWRPVESRLQPLTSTLYYRFEARDFLFEVTPRFDSDGLAHFVGFEQGWSLQPLSERNWIWDLSAGYRFGTILTEGREFDRTVNLFYVGAAVPLVRPDDPTRYLFIPDRELVFRCTAEWELANYRNNSLNDRDRDKRNDLLTTYGFSLSQTLIDDPKYGDLVISGIIHWTDAESNVTARNGISPFTYDKVVYGLQLVWSF